MESWCKAQLQAITKSSDMTLITFLTTLNDPSDIREYMAMYLGQGDNVKQFATEYLARRGIIKPKAGQQKAPKPSQQEWETGGKKKKKAGKK